MAYYQVKREQFIPASVEAVWDFISSPENLKTITPPDMGFEIVSQGLPEKIYPGMIITYKVSPLLGIKLDWMTEITQVKPGEFFIDEQRLGPYKMWHHQHMLKPVEGGVYMEDIITYIPPLGFLGRIANVLFIAKKVQGIFDHREVVLKKIFPA